MDEFNAGSNKRLELFHHSCSLSIGGNVLSSLPWLAVIVRQNDSSKLYSLGHPHQSLLLIFIQGTFLLNGHPVTLTQRYEEESSSSNYNASSGGGHRDYSRNNVNELRLRDWDCYKVKFVTLLPPRRHRSSGVSSVWRTEFQTAGSLF